MKAIASIVLAASVTWALPASAQFDKPETAIKYRQSVMFVMGQHFGRLGAMVQGKVPFDPKLALENAEIVAEMSKLPYPAFGPGTDKGAPTKAKPEIWTEQAKFKDDDDKRTAATIKLVAAAKTGNLDDLKAAFSETADTCKKCHDAFRKK